MKKPQMLWIAIIGLVFIFGFQTLVIGAEKEIRFGYLVADQLHNPAPMIMKEKKFLEAEGLKVNWGEFLAGSYLMQHLASGEVDFGTCGAVPVMITRGAGVDAVILAGSNQEGSAMVVANHIKEIKDLNGKSIGTPGIGSIQDAMVDMVAQKHNISINHKHMKVSDMAIFLKKGEIDGFIAWEAIPSNAVDMGYGRVLLTSHDILPEHQCCVLVAKGGLLKDDPETVKKIIRAYMKAFDYLKNNRDESVALMVKATGLSKNVVEMGLTRVTHPYPPLVNVPSLKLMADGLVKSGKIKEGVISDMDKFVADLYRPEFLKAYLK
ncbi:MAG: ABC transporter substrate-binding protein [Pseudomonadota bacterium]